MDLKRITDKIESHEFSAELNIASSYVSFFQYLSENKDVIRLKNRLEDNIILTKITERVKEIVFYQIDLRYENPWDIALCVYLWVIKSRSKNISFILAKLVSSVNNCWWAARYALDLLEEENAINVNSTDLTENEYFLFSGKLEWKRTNIFPSIVFRKDENSDEFLSYAESEGIIHNALGNQITIKSNDKIMDEKFLKGIHQYI